MFDDEGYELAKALLMTHQRLYAPVWWDQPPGHPALLQAGAALFGSGVQSFRLVAGLLGVSSLWALAACANPGRRSKAVTKSALPGAGSFLPHFGAPGSLKDEGRRMNDESGDAETSYLIIHTSNLLAPFAAVLLCISSMGFLSYGLSVTIMLPALGFGLWAVWLWQRFGLSGNRWVLFASGIVFGFGFQTKFTVLLFLPALAVEFAKRAWQGDREWGMGARGNAECGVGNAELAEGNPSPRPSPLAVQRAREKITIVVGFLSQWSGIWGAGFVYGVALVWAFFPEEDLVWLLKYHFRPEVTVPFQAQAGWSPMLHKLGLDWPIASFAVLGLFLGLVQRRWAVVFPTVLFATAFLAHAWHRPWWDYYYLHLSIPMAWLGALGVQWTWESLTRKAERGVRNDPSPRPSPLAAQRAREEGRGEAEGGHRPPLQGWRLREFWPGWRAAGLIAAFSFCLAGFLVELPERYERETAFLHAKPSPTEVKVLAELKERRADTRWLYTDRPIWCAHANILIPPELAVLSLKRIASGDITHAEFLRLLHHYRPEQILLQRRHFEDEKFHEFLNAFYNVVIEEGNLKYLVRRDWEAARKRKAAEVGSQKSGVRSREVRLLASAATTQVAPSPRPSRPVGAREKATDFPFATIRGFRGHLGGPAA